MKHWKWLCAALCAALLLGACAPKSQESAAPRDQQTPAQTPEQPQLVDPLTQQELWDKAAGYWFAKNDDGTVEFVRVYRLSNEYHLATGLFLSDMYTDGVVTSYSPRTDTIYSVSCNFTFNQLITDSGDIEYDEQYVTLDISQTGAGTLLFQGVWTEEQRSFAYAGADENAASDYYYANMAPPSAG